MKGAEYGVREVHAAYTGISYNSLISNAQELAVLVRLPVS